MADRVPRRPLQARGTCEYGSGARGHHTFTGLERHGNSSLYGRPARLLGPRVYRGLLHQGYHQEPRPRYRLRRKAESRGSLHTCPGMRPPQSPACFETLTLHSEVYQKLIRRAATILILEEML